MKLIEQNGTAHYCGKVKRRPGFTRWGGYTVDVVIDGKENTLYSNDQQLSKIVYFEHAGSWYYVSSWDISDKVRNAHSKTMVFRTSGSAERRQRITPRKVKLAHLFVGYTPELIGDSPIAKKERRDCTVRAMMESMGISYDEAHTKLKQTGRRDKKGIPMASTLARYFKEDFEEVIFRGTTGTFASQFQTGSYIVMVSRHAIAVVDGKIKDWSFRPNARVKTAFKYIGGEQ